MHFFDSYLHKDDVCNVHFTANSEIFDINNCKNLESLYQTIQIIKMPQSSPANSNSKNFDFVYCFRPFYYFSRICGFMPYSIIFDLNSAIHRPAVKICDILWFIIAIIVYHAMAIDHFIHLSQSAYSSSKVLNNSGWLLMVSSMIFGVIGIVMDMGFRFKFVDLLNKFNAIDRNVCSVCILIRSYFNYILLFQTSSWQKSAFVSIISESINAIGNGAWLLSCHPYFY